MKENVKPSIILLKGGRRSKCGKIRREEGGVCVCVCVLLFTCFQHTAATGEPFSLILLSLKHSQRSDIRCWLR